MCGLVRPPSRRYTGCFADLPSKSHSAMSTALIATMRDAFAAKRHRLAIHVLPEKFDVPRVRADEQRLEIKVDDLLGDARRQRGVADADEAVVGENFAR